MKVEIFQKNQEIKKLEARVHDAEKATKVAHKLMGNYLQDTQMLEKSIESILGQIDAIYTKLGGKDIPLKSIKLENGANERKVSMKAEKIENLKQQEKLKMQIFYLET